MWRPKIVQLYRRRLRNAKRDYDWARREIDALRRKLEKYQRDTMLETRFTTAKDIYR